LSQIIYFQANITKKLISIHVQSNILDSQTKPFLSSFTQVKYVAKPIAKPRIILRVAGI
jgi:hypothetical protein